LVVTDPEGRRLLVFDVDGHPVGQFGAESGMVKPVGVAVVQDGESDLVVVADSAACQVLAFRLLPP
jgi:hypothetical protein